MEQSYIAVHTSAQHHYLSPTACQIQNWLLLKIEYFLWETLNLQICNCKTKYQCFFYLIKIKVRYNIFAIIEPGIIILKTLFPHVAWNFFVFGNNKLGVGEGIGYKNIFKVLNFIRKLGHCLKSINYWNKTMCYLHFLAFFDFTANNDINNICNSWNNNNVFQNII